MSELQIEWIALLQKQDLPGWNIAADGQDVLIQIPDDQDLRLVYDNFPDTVIALSPDIKAAPRKLRFIIGNSKQSFTYELN